MTVVYEVELCDCPFDNTFMLLSRDSFEFRVKVEMLFYSQKWENCVVLRTVPDKLANRVKLCLNIVASHVDFPT